MSTRITQHNSHGRVPAARTFQPVRGRIGSRYPVKPPGPMVFPGPADAELDEPWPVKDTSASLRRPVASWLLRIVGSLGLALSLTGGYVCGLKLDADVSSLELGMIRVLGGFLALFFITVWPTCGE